MIRKLQLRAQRRTIMGFIDWIGPGPFGDALRAQAELYLVRDVWTSRRDADSGVISEW